MPYWQRMTQCHVKCHPVHWELMLLAEIPAMIYIHNPGQWRSWSSRGSPVTSQNYSNEECSTNRTGQVRLRWSPTGSRKIFLKVLLKSNLPFQLYTFFFGEREFFWALSRGWSQRGKEVWRAKRRSGTEINGNMRLLCTRNTRQRGIARTTYLTLTSQVRIISRISKPTPFRNTKNRELQSSYPYTSLMFWSLK